MYVGVFFIFWMPFGIMSAYSHIKKTFCNTWYNVGYTLSFGHALFLPLIFVLTDKNIQTNLSKKYAKILLCKMEEKFRNRKAKK